MPYPAEDVKGKPEKVHDFPFLPWPGEALVAVSANFLKSFKIDTTEENRNRLYELMASFQNRIRDMSSTYLSRMRKHVYVTPRSFLCFIEYYKKLYAAKYNEVNVQEKSVNIGLRKLEEAAKSVLEMQAETERQEEVLRMESIKTNELLNKVHGEKSRAEDKAEEVGSIAKDCEENASVIDADREEANRQLQEALPYLYEANAACQSIKDKDIVELKGNKAPVDIVKLTFDGLLLLMGNKVSENRLWLAVAVRLLAAVELEDPELTRSIQNLFEEEAEPAVSHTKLVDPFEEPKEFDSASADPFAELEKQSVKPSAKMATPKDPFAELASVSHSAPVALKDPFAELSSVSHSAPVALKDPFADLASSKAPATPKDPFAELSSVSHSAPVALKDPFADLASSKAPATPKDPFAELSSVSHSAPVALKDPFADLASSKAPATPKDPFAELSSVSHSAPVALKDPFADLASSKAPATPKDPFAELASVSHSAPVALKDPFADLASSKAPATPKDPFAELSSVSHSAPATSVAPATPAMKSAGPKSVPLIPSATVQAKPTPAEVKIPQSPVAQNVTALLKDKGSAKVNETKVVKLNSTKSAANRNHGTAQKVVASNQMKMNHNDSIHSAPTLPAEIKIQPTKRSHFLHPKVETKMTSPEATPQPAQVAPNLQRSPSSLAAFWSSEPRRPPEPNPKMAPLALVQHQAARKGIDFTKVQETKEDGEPEISISEPFASWEAEDQREQQRLHALDRRLRLRARRKEDQEGRTEVSQRSVKLVETSNLWAKLEEEDQEIEDKIVDLDDPRRPVDLRQYQQLNNMQDASMAQLEGPKSAL
ncbi:unnamed protein product [Cladocopium goreaui]|uniref:Dynein axonemal heavy chain 5 (Axonemal beta dynein heavy chain 5) (mDNAH5) (Ciliary dynein heavy chain 5) n=1 Tax=Cladocopium goreaui TaxID=2562237 RepID=A0A9P1DBF1_9DINO|nr:unnamed protein product [Cladocopium goreaui]